MKLCICDIDGVIVDSTKRFMEATVDGKIVWEKALCSELLHLDMLIPDAVKHLELLQSRYDYLILLTSRYDHMRNGTIEWLRQHSIPVYRLIMKPYADRHIKTKIWKANRILELLREYSEPGLLNAAPEPVTDLLIVEHEEQNREEVQQEVGRWILSNREMSAHYFDSLLAVAHAIEHAILF